MVCALHRLEIVRHTGMTWVLYWLELVRHAGKFLAGIQFFKPGFRLTARRNDVGVVLV